MSRKSGKRIRNIYSKMEKRFYTLEDAVAKLKEWSSVKFNESFDMSLNLGIDPKKSDQSIRGAIVLPHGTGRSAKVAVFAQGANAEAAKAAGADVVGFEDLAEKMKAGELNFDVVIATPDAMSVVGKLGQVLGPRGLMPNPKVGTVTPDVTTAIKNAKAGQVQYRNDKNGIVHCCVGKVGFEANQLLENLRAMLGALKKAKPNSAKGIYFKKLTLSTTMGPGLVIDLSTLSV